MSEVVILPEMVKQGVLAWQESEIRELGVEETVVEIYMAMFGALLLARERAGEPVH